MSVDRRPSRFVGRLVRGSQDTAAAFFDSREYQFWAQRSLTGATSSGVESKGSGKSVKSRSKDSTRSGD